MAATRPEPARAPDGQVPGTKKRNVWIWISALLAVVAAGLLIWALSVNSDLNSTQDQVDSLQSITSDCKAALGGA